MYTCRTHESSVSSNITGATNPAVTQATIHETICKTDRDRRRAGPKLRSKSAGTLATPETWRIYGSNRSRSPTQGHDRTCPQPRHLRRADHAGDRANRHQPLLAHGRQRRRPPGLRRPGVSAGGAVPVHPGIITMKRSPMPVAPSPGAVPRYWSIHWQLSQRP